MQVLNFEWDERKNIRNFQKHGIWFEEAKTIWADGHSIEFFDDGHSNDEDRFMRIGRSTKNRTLLVVFCERDQELIRIVSARRLTKKEKDQYEEGI